MFFSLRRLRPAFYSYSKISGIIANRISSKPVPRVAHNMKRISEQIEYINTFIMENKSVNTNWSDIKDNILNKQGVINKNNINSMLLKMFISNLKFGPALSFATYLKQNVEDLNIGTINALLQLYYELGKENDLSNEDKAFIMDTYKHLYEKYKYLDSKTCEQLLHALCVINEWKICLKLLDDITFSNTPSHSAFSILIATLFKNNKRSDALKLIQRSLDSDRFLLINAYKEWINYILRKYKDKDTIVKYLDEINDHLCNNFVTVNENVADTIRQTYKSLGWDAHKTRISRTSGQCMNCKERLDSVSLTAEEFNLLQSNVKQKLIIGTDLFLKSSPQELKRFQEFIAASPPYDIVLDALNIGYAVGKGSAAERIELLNKVVDYFIANDREILLLGRKHMLSWAKYSMNNLLKKVHSFFTDNLSQDDPYIITAAIMSGPQTEIVSKDFLRGHKFKLGDEKLRNIFQRWQWQCQWMVFSNRQKSPIFKPPLTFTPCAQKRHQTVHIPYEKENAEVKKILYDEVPDLTSWICLRPPPPK